MNLKNLHEASKILTDKDVIDLTNAFYNAWSKDTCYPSLRAKWSKANKALGQCAVTALVVQERYGGTFADDKHMNHIWNVLPDGSQHDFCRSQFESDVKLTSTRIRSRDDLLHHRKAEEVEMKKRYQLLKERVEKFLGGDSL